VLLGGACHESLGWACGYPASDARRALEEAPAEWRRWLASRIGSGSGSGDGSGDGYDSGYGYGDGYGYGYGYGDGYGDGSGDGYDYGYGDGDGSGDGSGSGDGDGSSDIISITHDGERWTRERALALAREVCQS
jgi:hypothetical protein